MINPQGSKLRKNLVCAHCTVIIGHISSLPTQQGKNSPVKPDRLQRVLKIARRYYTPYQGASYEVRVDSDGITKHVHAHKRSDRP